MLIDHDFGRNGGLSRYEVGGIKVCSWNQAALAGIIIDRATPDLGVERQPVASEGKRIYLDPFLLLSACVSPAFLAFIHSKCSEECGSRSDLGRVVSLLKMFGGGTSGEEEEVE